MEGELQIMQTRKTDRLNELAGVEIESKLRIASHHPINEVAEIIFSTLLNSVDQYGIAPSLPVVRLSKTVGRHYGYHNAEGKVKKAFTVTERDRDGLLQIKRKGAKTLYYQNVLSRTEYIEPLPWLQWTVESESAVIHQEAKLLDNEIDPKHIFLIGMAERQKLKIRVINKNNNRVYTIGVDETTIPYGKSMRQIEIEYVGIEPDTFTFGQETQAKTDGLVEMEIATEIKVIEQMVITVCSQVNVRLTPTRKTKSKWLRRMYKLNMDEISSSPIYAISSMSG